MSAELISWQTHTQNKLKLVEERLAKARLKLTKTDSDRDKVLASIEKYELIANQYIMSLKLMDKEIAKKAKVG